MNEHDADDYIRSRCRRLKAVIADVAKVNRTGEQLSCDRMSNFLCDLIDGIMAIEETLDGDEGENLPWTSLPDPPDAGRNHHTFPEVEE